MPENEKSLQIEINENSFEIPALKSKRGKTWWAVVDDNGKTSGREIEPLSDALPTSMSLEGIPFEFAPVVLSNSDGTTTTKPFHKTRMVQEKAELHDMDISFNCRITKRRNGKWWLSFRANPTNTNRRPRGKVPSEPTLETEPDNFEKLWEQN